MFSLNRDLGGKREHVVAVEWRSESDHLIQDTAGGPHISLLSVRLAFHNLWTNAREFHFYTIYTHTHFSVNNVNE